MTALEIIGAMILSGLFVFNVHGFLYREQQCSLMGWLALVGSIVTGFGVADMIL